MITECTKAITFKWSDWG